MNGRRRVKEREAAERPRPEGPDEVWHQLQELLDEELTRLPDRYRIAVVLCDLEGRTLRSLFARRLVEPRVSHTDSVVSYAHATAAEIGAGLPDIVRGLLVPLYESFEFLEVPPQVVEEELNEMRQRG